MASVSRLFDWFWLRSAERAVLGQADTPSPRVHELVGRAAVASEVAARTRRDSCSRLRALQDEHGVTRTRSSRPACRRTARCCAQAMHERHHLDRALEAFRTVGSLLKQRRRNLGGVLAGAHRGYGVPIKD